MDASKKQREPVAFKSLAELKRFIRPGVEIKTVSHANHADMVGLTRVVTTVQTVGFYSKIKDQPEHPFSTCNHGKGFYTDFGKAGKYIFDGTTVKVKDSRKQDRGVIYELEFYDREQNMEETMMDRKMVNFIKEQYPPGTRIRLNSMEDPYAPILPGTEGEVDFVDDKGETAIPPELQYVEVISVTASSGYDANTGEVVDEKELPSTVTLLVTTEQAKVLAELEQDSELHLALVYRGTPENAAKFIAAQDALIEELYAEPEPENSGETAEGTESKESEGTEPSAESEATE